MKERGRILKSVAIDTGGTMTDAVIMDTEGEFTVGKAVIPMTSAPQER